MKPHKHAELIKAWADGAEIEYKVHNGGWVALGHPSWEDHNEYRIKPKQPVVRWEWAYKTYDGSWIKWNEFLTEKEVLETPFVKTTVIPFPRQYIKLEYTRTEFPE